MAKNGVRRREALLTTGIRRLGTKESGFRYLSPDGKRIADPDLLERIRFLRIPPAWRDVRIARSESAALQAIGTDSKGRTQYLYHRAFRSRRELEKFKRVVEFGERLPELRRRVRADLRRDDLSRERVVAAIVRLIDQGFFRVGNDKSAKDEKTYGLTTVTPDHVDVHGSTVSFDYMGKWKKAQRRSIVDAQVADVIRQMQKLKGRELFKYVAGGEVRDIKDRHVNDYIQSIIGDTFTAKDFRTWAGTLLCSMALGWAGQASTRKQRKKNVKQAITLAAEQLGNTPAVCRASYICPRVLEDYEEGRPFEKTRKQLRGRPVARIGLSLEEKALLRFLRQTIADRRLQQRRQSARDGSDRRSWVLDDVLKIAS
jgi:DNA topoisomerase I